MKFHDKTTATELHIPKSKKDNDDSADAVKVGPHVTTFSTITVTKQ